MEQQTVEAGPRQQIDMKRPSQVSAPQPAPATPPPAAKPARPQTEAKAEQGGGQPGPAQPAPGAQPAEPATQSPEKMKAQSSEEKLAEKEGRAGQVAQDAAKQRVVFVLRYVPGLPVASDLAAEKKAEAAKPAEAAERAKAAKVAVPAERARPAAAAPAAEPAK